MKKLICLLFPLSGLLIVPAFGQKDTIDVTYEVKDTLNKNIRLFESDKLLELTLRFDINAYKKEKTDTAYQNAILTYHISETDSINKEIKLRARGELRRDYCDFPPIRLNFRKSESLNDEFSNVDKLKLVTHCKLGNEEYTLKEFLIYKLYNVLTENSFKVRLARINYINTGKQSKQIKQFAFIIEPLEALCKRTNSVEVKVANISQKNIKPEIMDRMAIFNYVIGNTDWSVPIKHNIVVLSQGGSDRPNLGVILPFDFDYAGLVNADYAVPYAGLGLASVRDRKYLGVCRDKEVFINELKEFLDKKEEFYKVINEFPYLKEKSKKDMIAYLDGFFSGIDKRNTIAYKILEDCLVF
ncbi:MAG: hypothetical protein NTZ85_08155 [Bacteroidia bacterium]|jgi:hypothetical protein|nr:hypothetical protein [Bacteroidia bacterium]